MKRFLLWVVLGLTSFLHARDRVVDVSKLAAINGERPLVVIVPSYNNKDWCERNLDSIFNQKYSNYRVIYIDDCSPDKTYKYVQKYIDEHNVADKISLIRNKKNCGALANLYKAIHLCPDHAIIVTIDGDDWLHGDQVFAKVNEAYAGNNVWMTYGQYLEYPRNKLGICKHLSKGIIKQAAYRECNWVTSHLRTFYAGLFKKIKLQDFLYQGEFFSVTWDYSFIMPMLEMSAGRFKFIEDILYEYNMATPLNDFKKRLIFQLHCEKYIRSKKKYEKLDELYVSEESDQRVRLIILSHDRPINLFALLERVEQHVKNLESVVVLYQASDKVFRKTYERMNDSFKKVTFKEVVPILLHEALLLELINTSADYIMFARDGVMIKEPIHISSCVRMLEQTHAHGFYLSLDHDMTKAVYLSRPLVLPPSTRIDDMESVYAWKFKDGEYEWRTPFSLSMALYRKKDLFDVFIDASFASCNQFKVALNSAHFDLGSVGLFYPQAKVAVWQPDPEDVFDTKNLEMFFNNKGA